MTYTIYRKQNIVAKILAQGSLNHKVMGEELVTMEFSSTEKINFKINDTVEVYGNVYHLLNEPTRTQVNTKSFSYNLQFGSSKYELSKIMCLFPDANNNLTLPSFSINGSPALIIDLILQNVNRVQSGWTLGTVDVLDGKQIDFSEDNCLTALAKLALEFDTEYWIEGKKIHLTKKSEISGLTLEYGKGKGLKDLTETPLDNSNVCTRLYAVGSTKNIPSNYRNFVDRLQMDVSYLESNIVDYGVIEYFKIFDNVYPHRLGTVTTIDSKDCLSFTDSDIDFDLNATDSNGTTILINGVSAKVTFNTGQLAGLTFEVKDNGYNSATKTFKLLENKADKNFITPNKTIRPAVGDTYVITDIIMPQTYIANAESELKEKAQAYLTDNSKQRFVYKATPDQLYFKRMNINLELGSYIRLKSHTFNIDNNLRVVSVTRDLQNPYDVDFELSERAALSQIVRSYFKEQKQQIVFNQRDEYNAQLAKRSYQFAREFHDNVFDGEGYFDPKNIKPKSIETNMLTVGSKMQQFNLPGIEFKLQSSSKIEHTKGKLVHLTIGEDVREWNILKNSLNGISTAFNYIYVKADKKGSNASIIVTEAKIKVDTDADYYHFHLGSLSSVIAGTRRIKTSFGLTQITPGEISTGRWTSPNGTDYIEFGQNGINMVGDFTFKEGSKGFKQVTDAIEIGGRNLLRNYDNLSKWSGEGGVRIIGNKVTVTGSGNLGIYQDVTVEKNKKYILSFFTVSSNKGRIGIGGHSSSSRWNGIKSYTPQKIGLNEFKFNSGASTKVRIYLLNGSFELSSIQLEEGNKRTTHRPATEDVQAAIDKQADKVDFISGTKIYGSNIATKTLAVGNKQGANAGITGEEIGDKAIRFWAGADILGMDTAPFRVLDDGTVFLDKAFIKGYVQATSGFIGSYLYGIRVNEDGTVEIGSNIAIDEGKSYHLSKDGLSLNNTVTSGLGSENVILKPEGIFIKSSNNNTIEINGDEIKVKGRKAFTGVKNGVEYINGICLE